LVGWFDGLINVTEPRVNSRDGISGKGNITLRVRMEVLDESAASDLDLNPGKYREMSVSDDGCGIPDNIIDKITEPFFSTKTFSCGLGLGMSTIARLIEAMHGRLDITSELNTGTTITIQFPVDLEDSKFEPQLA